MIINSASSESSLIFTSVYVTLECTCISKQELASMVTLEKVDQLKSTVSTILHNLNQAFEVDDKNLGAEQLFANIERLPNCNLSTGSIFNNLLNISFVRE